MITRLTLRNFGPYENANVSLDDFTTILGPNGSGKSVLFTALKAVGRVVKYPLRSKEHPSGYQTRTGNVSFDDIVHKRDVSKTMALGVEFSTPEIDGEYEVHLRHWQSAGGILVEEKLDVRTKTKLGHVRISADEQGGVSCSIPAPSNRFRTPRFVSIPGVLFRSRDLDEKSVGHLIQRALCDRIGVYRFDPTALKTPADLGRALSPTGYNFATHLDRIQNEPGGKQEFENLLTRFRRACPHVQDIGLPLDGYPGNGEAPRKRVSFTMASSSQTIPGDLESDGTILLLAYASLLHGSRAYDTICIEEPENGVHPKAIPAQVKMLRDLAEPHQEKPGAQILVCSHSLRFLEEVMSRPSKLRLVRRGADGRSVVEVGNNAQLPSLPGWAGLS